MNWLDAVLGIILLASSAGGFRRGFSRQIIGLISGVLALLLGIWFYGMPAAWFASAVAIRSDSLWRCAMRLCR